MPFDATVTFADGSQHVYKGVPDGTAPEAVSAQASKEFGKPVAALDGGQPGGGALKEVGRVADKVVRGGLTQLPGLIGDAALGVMRNAGDLPFMPGTALPKLLASIDTQQESLIQATKFGDVTKAIQTAGGLLPPVSEPQTSGGKAAANVLEPVVGTVAGGGSGTVLHKALAGLAAGSGGELAARIGGDNVLSRLLGSLLGGGLFEIGSAIRGNADEITKTATKAMTDTDWKRAESLEKTLTALSIPHLKSQLLGDKSTLDDVIAVASSHPSARPILEESVKRSVPKARTAVSAWSDKYLPVAPDSRKVNLDEIQQVAQDRLNGILKSSNTAFEKAMPPQTLEYPKERVQQLYDEIVALAKSPKFGETVPAGQQMLAFAERLMKPGNGKLDLSGVNPVILRRAQAAGADLASLPGAKIAKEPITNAHEINNLIKGLKTLSTETDWKSLPTVDLKRVMKAATPEFDAARAAKTAVINQEFYPVSKGLAGQIAQMGGGVDAATMRASDRAINLVFPKDMAQPAEIRQLAKDLGPETVSALLKAHIDRAMQNLSKTTGDIPARVQQPSKFVDAIAGTQAQKANLQAALESVAKYNGERPEVVTHGFYRLLRSLDSFGDAKLAGMIDRASLHQDMGKNAVATAVAPHSRLGRVATEMQIKFSAEKLANIVTSKDGLQTLRKIAQEKSPERLRELVMGVTFSADQSAGETPRNTP